MTRLALGSAFALLALSTSPGVCLAADAPSDIICPDDPHGALLGAAEGVEASFYDLEQVSFDLARHKLLALTGCVASPITAEQAAALHRARAIVSFVADDLDAARRAFAALHTLDPSWSPDPERLPVEHPLWRLYEQSVGDDPAERTLPLTVVPEHGYRVDGTFHAPPEEGERAGDHALPADRAFVLQVHGAGGSVAYTGYHLSTVDIPLSDLVVLPDPRKRRRRARAIGTSIGGALLAGAAVTFGLGMAERGGVVQQTVPVQDIDEVQVRANVLGATSAGLAGAAVLATTVTWAVRW